MRSVLVKLSAAFLAVAVLQTVLTATFSSYLARQTFRQYVERADHDSKAGPPGGPIMIVRPGGIAPPGLPARRPFGAREILFSSRFRNAIWAGTLVAAGVGVLFALWLASRIVKPVVRLTEAARAVVQGHPAPLVPESGNDEVAELTRAFNRMMIRLAEETEQRRRLFAAIAHELRTPLSVIQGTLEGVLDRVLDPTPERIAALHSQSLLLGRLITDLRDLSLAEAGHLPLHRRTIDISGVVRETVEALSPLADERVVGLRIELPASTLTPVQADPDRMRQVVQNLVENALRNTPPGGEVRVTLRDGNGDGVHLLVADNGQGIGPEDLPHIFEHFYRTDEARARSRGGTGMGLAIVKSLVEAHGGQVSVASAPGAGSTFTVTLPTSSKEGS
jgi:two-component system, OmpR family, sensor histidine kinase BaeS